MRILNPRIHGMLDYLTVIIFALAPSLLGMSKTPTMIAYTLAAVHLLLTLATAFPLGLVKLVPFTVQGAIELIVSVALLGTPWLFGFGGEPAARMFYVVIGVVIFAVWLTTAYSATAESAPASA